MKKTVALVLIIALVWFVFLHNPAVEFGPGVFAPDAPLQIELAVSQPFQFKDYELTPLARFQIKAKVLSKKNYRWDREAELSPVDLALGWGRMSDEAILDDIDISQSNRWYHWWTDTFPIPREEIETHSGNMHLIPKNETVKSAIKRARRGQIVELSGYLVRVEAKDGWQWGSSLSRSDTGSRSCELIWVERFTTDKGVSP